MCKNNDTFGEYVRVKRLRKHITIREMAELLGISASLYCDYEHERRKPPAEVLDGISDQLALSDEDQDELRKLAETTTYHPPRPIDDPQVLLESDIAHNAIRCCRGHFEPEEWKKEIWRREKMPPDKYNA